MSSSRPPIDIIPVLSRGRHRNPRSGACFMEFASFLAGEKWSDHPSCTHPALAALARAVNDWTADDARSRLAPMIPTVIGLRPRHPALELALAIRAAAEAIGVASEERQRLLAIGLIRAIEQLWAIAPDDGGRFAPIARSALDRVPFAECWARQHIAYLRPPRIRSATPMCDAVIQISVAGIAEACVDDVDERLRRLLRIAIDECSEWQAREQEPVPVPVPAGAAAHAH